MRQSAWSLATAALERGQIVRGSVHHPMIGESVPVENVPVRCGDRVVAVMVRVYTRSPATPTSMYEKNYLEVFERLVQMVTEAEFPFPEEDIGTEETPRVGDGFVLVDAEGHVEFASPNAMNAFHRMGVYSPPEGRRFTELGVEESAVEWALATGRPVVEEVERRPDVMVLVHCIPLMSSRTVTGAVILLRDVTDVRRCAKRSAGCARSPWCTRSCRGTLATRCRSGRSSTPWCRWPRTRWSRPGPSRSRWRETSGR